MPDDRIEREAALQPISDASDRLLQSADNPLQTARLLPLTGDQQKAYSVLQKEYPDIPNSPKSNLSKEERGYLIGLEKAFVSGSTGFFQKVVQSFNNADLGQDRKSNVLNAFKADLERNGLNCIWDMGRDNFGRGKMQTVLSISSDISPFQGVHGTESRLEISSTNKTDNINAYNVDIQPIVGSRGDNSNRIEDRQKQDPNAMMQNFLGKITHG